MCGGGLQCGEGFIGFFLWVLQFGYQRRLGFGYWLCWIEGGGMISRLEAWLFVVGGLLGITVKAARQGGSVDQGSRKRRKCRPWLRVAPTVVRVEPAAEVVGG